jgi:hypothetical protein
MSDMWYSSTYLEQQHDKVPGSSEAIADVQLAATVLATDCRLPAAGFKVDHNLEPRAENSEL